MRGFGAAICAWAWMPSAWAASTTFRMLPELPPSTGRQKDRLSEEVSRAVQGARSLCRKERARLGGREEGLLPGPEPGGKFEDLVLSELNSLFAETGLLFGSFLPSRCVSKLKADGTFPGLFSEYLRSSGFDERVKVTFQNGADLSEGSRDRVRMILAGVFRKKREKVVMFERFPVEIVHHAWGEYSASDSGCITGLILEAYPDVLLSVVSREHLKEPAELFEIMLHERVPKDATSMELGSYYWVSELLACQGVELLLKIGLIYRRLYSDYHGFVQRMLLGQE